MGVLRRNIEGDYIVQKVFVRMKLDRFWRKYIIKSICFRVKINFSIEGCKRYIWFGVNVVGSCKQELFFVYYLEDFFVI